MYKQEHLPFSKKYLTNHDKFFKRGSVIGFLGSAFGDKSKTVKNALQRYLYDNFINALYALLGFFTYIYLTLSVIAFFFQKHISSSIPYIVDTLSEPYLGALGMYVVIKEINRSRGRVTHRRWGEYFVLVWTIFFITASLTTYFSDAYYFDEVYKVIATNSLAALIIRIGAFIK